MTYEEFHSYPFGVFTDKLLIAVRFRAAKVEIAVRKCDVVPTTPQQFRQHHRVDAAAQGNEDAVTFFNEVM